jgi:predicted transposase YbfD/YdcC
MEITSGISISIQDYFGELEDPRQDINKQHRLSEILIIALCAMLCGAEGFDDMAEFGLAKEPWLRTFLALEYGIPSHDTFRRVFCLLKPEAFIDSLVRWTQAIRETISGEIVAIDGKSLRRTGKTKESIVHLVSAWAATNRLVLGQIKVDGKSNEITAIPHLLRVLELSGCIVTLDAMGCQKNIAKEIHEADADYVLSLKGNQGTAREEVGAFLDDAIARKESHLDYHEQVEKDHGRIETRKAWISEQIDWFADRKDWENLRSVGVIEERREVIGGKTTTERRYFLCSLPPDAKKFAHAVRTHWTIENTLHWVLDVSLQEDQSRVRSGYAAENLALLRKLALNLIRKDVSAKRKSVKGRQKRAAWSNDYLLTLLGLAS